MRMQALRWAGAGSLFLLVGMAGGAVAGVVAEGRAGEKYIYRVNGVTVVLNEGDVIDGCTVTDKGLICSEEQLAENAPGGKVVTEFADVRRAWEECEGKLKAATDLISEKDQALTVRERELSEQRDTGRKAKTELAEVRKTLSDRENTLEESRKALAEAEGKRTAAESRLQEAQTAAAAREKTEDRKQAAPAGKEERNVVRPAETPPRGVAAAATPAPAPDAPGEHPEASTRLLAKGELEGRSAQELRMLRNEIFARHSYRFKTRDLQEHFGRQSWYRAKHDDVTPMLTDIERANITLINRMERGKP